MRTQAAKRGYGPHREMVKARLAREASLIEPRTYARVFWNIAQAFLDSSNFRV